MKVEGACEFADWQYGTHEKDRFNICMYRYNKHNESGFKKRRQSLVSFKI